MNINVVDMIEKIIAAIESPAANKEITWEGVLTSISKIALIAVKVTEIITQDEDVSLEFPGTKSRDLELDRITSEVLSQIREE